MTAAGATIGKSLLYESEEPACYAGYLVRFRPSEEADGRFISYWLESHPYWDQIRIGKVVSTIENFSASKYQNLRLYVPDIARQRAIADYLDAETARIDALLMAHQTVLDLLSYRPVIESEEALSPSRLHSDLWPLKYLVAERDERLGGRDSLPLLSVSIHRGVVPRDELTDKLPRAEELSNYKICRTNDIVLNRMRAFQGGVGVALHDGIVSPDYTVMTVGPRLDARFAHYLMRAPWFVGQMISRLRGIGGVEQGNVRTPRVGFGDLGQIRVPLPSLPQQRDLVARLDHVTSHARRSSEVIARQVSLLKEHRQALITAAVTGELEVPEVAA